MEYCGMMDDEEYVLNHVRKKKLYEKAGVMPWDNIIYIYERGNKMDLERIDYYISKEIIPRM